MDLPSDFADLADLVPAWSLPTERARKERRASAAMDDIRSFYDRLQPRITQIAQHLGAFEYRPDSLPEAETHLLRLACMYMETAMAVEFYRRPEPEAAFPRDRFVIENIRI